LAAAGILAIRIVRGPAFTILCGTLTMHFTGILFIRAAVLVTLLIRLGTPRTPFLLCRASAGIDTGQTLLAIVVRDSDTKPLITCAEPLFFARIVIGRAKGSVAYAIRSDKPPALFVAQMACAIVLAATRHIALGIGHGNAPPVLFNAISIRTASRQQLAW